MEDFNKLLSCIPGDIDRYESAIKECADNKYTLCCKALIKNLLDVYEVDVNNMTIGKYEEECKKLIYKVMLYSYYGGLKELGLSVLDGLILSKGVDCSSLGSNLMFFSDKMQYMKKYTIPFVAPKSTKGESYNTMNPSIVCVPDGYSVCMRTVNYNQVGARSYNSMDDDGKIRTRNFILKVGIGFELGGVFELVDKAPYERRDTHILGQEDVQICFHDKKIWYFSTILDSRIAHVTLGVGRIDENSDKLEIDVKTFVPLRGPDPNRVEKNWNPFSYKGDLCYLYSFDPFTIKKVLMDDEGTPTGYSEDVLVKEQTADLSMFRGGGGPVQFKYNERPGYLFIPHEVYYREHARIYLHRFVWTDEEFNVRAISNPFCLEHFGIEFVRSMTYSHYTNRYIIAAGIEDKEAVFYEVDKSYIESVLKTRFSFTQILDKEYNKYVSKPSKAMY